MRHARHAAQQFLLVVEPAVRQAEEADLAHAKGRGAADALSAPDLRQFLRGGAGGRVFQPKAPVQTDQKTDLFAFGGKARGGGAGADLDIVRVRADEQTAPEVPGTGSGRGETKSEAGETHADRPFCQRAFDSARSIMIIGWQNQSMIRLISLPNDKFGSE